jgi:hypothetical protein
VKLTKRKLFGVSLAIVMSVALAQAADGSDSESGKLQGTWFTQVAIRDCGTGAVLRTFSAVNTFNTGETMIDTTTGASPSLRSPGLGKWEKNGERTYAAVSLALLFSPAGVWVGTQKLTHKIEVSGDENAFTTRSEVFDPAGVLLSSGCATAVGRRL